MHPDLEKVEVGDAVSEIDCNGAWLFHAAIRGCKCEPGGEQHLNTQARIERLNEDRLDGRITTECYDRKAGNCAVPEAPLKTGEWQAGALQTEF
jgi:hypothetical protein